MKSRIFGVLILLLWSSEVASDSATGCDFPAGWHVKSNSSGDLVAFSFAQNPVPISMPITLYYVLCLTGSQPAETSDVDAIMPKHQHGLNYYPTVETIGKNRFQASGIVFHMQGEWEIQVTANPEKEPRKITFDLVLE